MFRATAAGMADLAKGREMGNALVIDDQPEMLNMMKIVLERLGFDVTAAPSGKSIVHDLDDAFYDIIVTDIFMPDTDGIEVIRKLRSSRPDIPVLAVSGGGTNLDGDFLRVAKLLGASDVLQKPFMPDDLKRAVQDLIAGDRSIRGSVGCPGTMPGNSAP